MSESRSSAARAGTPIARFWIALCVYGGFAVVLLGGLHLFFGGDYVGADNDDVMRLVEVRNFLGGQGWFDVLEPRMGLGPGLLMHWSRLVDLPIAGLILFFRLFLDPLKAEAAALFIWPLLLVMPTLAAMGLGGLRLGGVLGMHLAFLLTMLQLLTGNRFLPGAIDHHNVQILLMAVLAAMLIDPRHRVESFVAAGFAAALAIAVGAETTPIVAIACMAVAVIWAWRGAPVGRATAAFALTVTVGVTLSFFATVPPSRYGMVVCDSLSLGFYGTVATGGGLLFLAAISASGRPRFERLAVLVPIGAVVCSTAWVLMPQCLGDPLAGLDPLLRSLWLDNVREARSFLAEARLEGGTFGGFYAVGFFAIMVCLFRIWRGDRVEAHAVLLALLAASYGLALIQVRGAAFSNLFAVLPLAALIAELKRASNEDPENISAGFFYLVTVLISVPAVWAVMGVLAVEGTGGISERLYPQEAMRRQARSGPAAPSCQSPAAFEQLAGLAPGLVAAPVDFGPDILRYTEHRVLSGPYHRNQAGMLTELHIGLALPGEAIAFLRGAGVDWLAFCRDDPATRQIVQLKPDGLYAALMQGQAPDYLEVLPRPRESGLRIFRVKEDLR